MSDGKYDCYSGTQHQDSLSFSDLPEKGTTIYFLLISFQVIDCYEVKWSYEAFD